MKIVLLNDSFPPVIDGVANAVLNYAEILTAKGHQVLVVTPEYPNVVDEYPFEVVRYKSVDATKLVGYRVGMPFDSSMLHRVETFAPDLIHSHCPIISQVLARVLRKITGAPLIFTYHTKFDIEIQKYIAGDILRDAAKKVLADGISASDDIWVVSNGAGENLLGLGYAGRYTVMENGVDFPYGGVTPEEIKKVPELVSLPENIPVFLFVGRMMWYKGVRISLDALKLAKDEGLDFRMILIGDGAEKEEMAAYTADIGLTDKVIFTGAIRDRELLRAYFTRSDLFLFPSTFDTNGIVVREAAACALPSVLIRGSCAAEGITDGKNGILIEEDAESMFNAIRFACHERQKIEQIGRSALEDIYIPWSLSVEHAIERYQIVVDRAQKGEYMQAESRKEDFYEVVSDIYASMERIRDVQTYIQLKRAELHERVEEIIEDHTGRYL